MKGPKIEDYDLPIVKFKLRCVMDKDVPMGGVGGRLAPKCPRNGKKVGDKTDPLTCITKHNQI